jgi:hypothetical protein
MATDVGLSIVTIGHFFGMLSSTALTGFELTTHIASGDDTVYTPQVFSQRLCHKILYFVKIYRIHFCLHFFRENFAKFFYQNYSISFLAQNEIYKMDTNGSKLFSLIFVEKWRFS